MIFQHFDVPCVEMLIEFFRESTCVDLRSLLSALLRKSITDCIDQKNIVKITQSIFSGRSPTLSFSGFSCKNLVKLTRKNRLSDDPEIFFKFYLLVNAQLLLFLSVEM